MTHKKPSFYVLLTLILGVIFFYLNSQEWIGSETPSICLIGDRLQNWTASINAYLTRVSDKFKQPIAQ
jgi:hypothetical protein